MRMIRGFCENVLNHAARPLPCALIWFQDDLDCQSGPYVFPVLTVHSEDALSSNTLIVIDFIAGKEENVRY